MNRGGAGGPPAGGSGGGEGGGGGGGGGRQRVQNASRSEKETQFWAAIEREKLDTLKYVMLHSGINTIGLQNDDGLTAVQTAAAGGKAKALLLMLDIMRQQRCIKDAIDAATEEGGKTALMLAAEKGHVKCVDHLLYYGASKTARSSEGRVAREYAAARKAPAAELMELFDEDVEEAPSAGGAPEVADADGLTSTQRSKLKKKAMKEAEQKGLLAAIAAAADKGAEAAGAGGGGGGGGGDGEAALGPHGLPPLPKPAPTPVWPELAAAFVDAAKVAQAKRELRLERREAAAGEAPCAGGGGGGGGAEGAGAGAGAGGEGQHAGSHAPASDGTLDPSVWHLGLLNRLELHVPGLGQLSPLVGHLASLQTLIVSGCGLTALPDSLACLAELKYLEAQRNRLSALPPSLAQLKRLEVVDVSDNALTALGPLSSLTSLTTLLADRNALEEVVLDFAGLARLETLSLSGNRLKSLPEEIGTPQLFAVLNVADNELTALPRGLANMKEKKIRELKLLPNPFEDPKIRKVLAKEDRVEMVKELFKLLAKQAGGGKKK